MPAKNSPLFSIIIPAYNVEEYISQCIESVLGQSTQDFELIIIDDGSTDQTGEICEKYTQDHPQYVKKQPQPSIISQTSKKVNTNYAKTSEKVNFTSVTSFDFAIQNHLC